ncbi:hypothetical protein [Agromyces sp. ZXT2-6]|uniref:hypothetical protein n=1 Tax=Agromyces sp. ZXT2-6 TaxID=3461153 RepID=UPI004054E987
MRWPWQRSASAPSPAPASPRPSPAGWAFLPPLQRQLSDTPPSTLSAGFVSSLPTRLVPARMGSLGHLVDPGAPAGTVAGGVAELGAPVQRAVIADLTLRPPAWGSSRASAGRSAATDAASPAPRVVPPQADAAAASPPLPDPSPGREEPQPGAPDLPVRTDGRTATGDRAAASTPPASSLPLAEEQTAHADERADPEVDLPDAAETPDPPEPPHSPGEHPGTLEASSAVLADRPLPAGGGVPLQPSVQRETTDAARRSAAPPSIRAPSTPVVRRLGLGAPLPTSNAGPSPAPGPPPVSGPAPAVQRIDAASAGAAPTASSVVGAGQGRPGASVPDTPADGDTGPVDAGGAPSPGASTASEPADGEGRVAPDDGGATGERALLGSVPHSSALAPMAAAGEPDRTASAIDEFPLANRSSTGVAASADDPSSVTPVGDSLTPSTPSGPEGGEPEPETETILPLIAQRTLTPLLTAPTGSAPAGRRHPRAVAVVPQPPSIQRADSASDLAQGGGAASSPGGRASASAVGSEPARGGRTTPPSGAAPVDPDEPARGGVLGWLQRLVAPGPQPASPSARAPGAESPPTPPAPPAAAPVAEHAHGRRAGVDPRSHSPEVHALGGQSVVPGPDDGAGRSGPVRDVLQRSAAVTPQPATIPEPAAAPSILAAAPGTATPFATVHGARSGPAPVDSPPIAPPPPPRRAPLPVAASAAEPSVQREAESAAEPPAPSEPPGPPPETPSTSSDGSTSSPDAAASATATGAAAAATAALGADAAATSPAAIETLAGQLYGPLVRRLKAELLLDRERRGVRIDGI